MVTVISRFRVRNGLEEDVRTAFLNRPRLVERESGFCGLEVLTDASDPAVFLLVTRWTTTAAFRAWHSSDAHHHSHQLIPQGLKLDASFTQLVVGNRIEDPAGVSNISDAVEGQTVALSRWLMDSDVVFALILTADGTIRVRNRAGSRVFSRDPASSFGLSIWDYLACADVAHLKGQLTASSRTESHFLLNLTTRNKEQISGEVSLIDCSGGFLLVGAIEQKYDQRLHDEMQMLTNQLSVTTRDLSRKNRELEEANRTIERISHTDVLTGLSNRRMFDVTLGQHITQANRQGHALALMIADIDHFKAINDEHGHIIGDHVLTAVGKVLGTGLRPYDLASRYGGEEFGLLFPGTVLEDAVIIAERLRKEIASIRIPEVTKSITISLGVAAWHANELAEAFIARADSALYRAKEAGRNRVEVDGLAPQQP